MNLQLANINPTLTMSTREIALLIGKQHPNVKISAERLSNSGVIGTLAMQEFNHNGNIYTEYLLCKRDSLILVAQNCPEFTARIVDRWQELETQMQEIRTYGMVIPKSYGEALVALGNSQIENEIKSKQLEAAKPKVDYVDNYVDRNHLKSVTDVAKELGVSGKALGKWLREEGHAWSKHSSLRWTQPFMDKGYGEMKQYTSAGGFDGTQALVTASGDLFIKQNFSK